MTDRLIRPAWLGLFTAGFLLLAGFGTFADAPLSASTLASIAAAVLAVAVLGTLRTAPAPTPVHRRVQAHRDSPPHASLAPLSNPDAPGRARPRAPGRRSPAG
jgi:hypothetical protein